MKAAKITKGPRETYNAYMLRKCRAAAKEGVRFCVFDGMWGSGDIYAKPEGGDMVLLAIADSYHHGLEVIRRVGGWR